LLQRELENRELVRKNRYIKGANFDVLKTFEGYSWNGIFYDEKMTNAIIDRLIHHSHLLVFTGQSYRLKYSTMNC